MTGFVIAAFDIMYSKELQIDRNFRTFRNPEKLRKLLRLKMPETIEQSLAERYGRCAHPSCVAYGTMDHPLDMHHVVPKSQSGALQDDFTNHLYLCGDFFHKNHHKALHGEATPGRADWIALGVFDEHLHDPLSEDEIGCKQPVGQILKALMEKDHMARVLYKTDPKLLVEYAQKKHVVSGNIDPQFSLLHEWMA